MAEKTKKELDAEAFEDHLAVLKAITVEKERTVALTQAEHMAIRAIATANQDNVKAAERRLQIAEKMKPITDAAQAANIREVASLKEEVAIRKARKALMENRSADMAKAMGLMEKQKKAAAAMYEEERGSLGTTKERNEGLKTSVGILNSAANAAGDLGAMMFDIAKLGPDLALGKLLDYDIGIKAIGTAMGAMTKQIDDSTTGMVKKTGLDLQKLQAQAVAAVSPEYAIKKNETLRNQLKALGEDGKVAFTEMGITIQESSAATLELVTNAAAFRVGAGEADQAATLLTTNLVAGLSKVGVKQSQSVKMINLYTKAMKKTPIEANKAIKKLVGVSKAMGVSLETAFSNFESAAPVLSQFGDRMGDVFANMQARAAATGGEFKNLISAAMKMDTFEGAAKAAQGFNAILGDTLISTTELVNADPEEKFAIIARAVKASGKEFGDFDRRLQMQMAGFAGLSSAAELSKQIYNTDAVEAASAATDANASSNEDLAKVIGDSQTVLEKQKASLSAMAGGMSEALPKLRGAAEKMSKSISAGFKATEKSTDSALAAVIGMKVALKGAGGEMDEVVTKFTGAVEAAGKYAVFAGAAVSAIKELGSSPTRVEADSSMVEPTKTVPVKAVPVSVPSKPADAAAATEPAAKKTDISAATPTEKTSTAAAATSSGGATITATIAGDLKTALVHLSEQAVENLVARAVG